MKTNFFSMATAGLIMFCITSCFAGKNTGAADTFGSFEAAYELEVAGTGAIANPDQPRFGRDSVTCVKNWSLYSEHFRQRNFAPAIGPWRWMFLNCPRATENLYIHGATLVNFMLHNETNPAKREALIDTLLMVHDQRIKYFGREGFVLGRKASDFYRLRPDASKEHFEISERSIELEGNASQAEVLTINFQSAVRLVEAGLLDAEVIVKNYDRAIEYIENSIANNPADTVFFNPARELITGLFEPFASCENLVRIYRPRFDANPDDPELLEKITAMLNRSGCTEDPLFFLATRNFHRLRPTAQSAFLMGRLESNQRNFAQALEYFEQAAALTENGNGPDRFTTFMLMADILYRNLNRMPQARTLALRASEVRPNDGRPFLLIGEMYTASARSCGTDEISTAAIYWAAVDKFIKARNVDSDPQVISRANQLIAAFSQHFPSNEILFFHGLDGGKTVRAECWINETTVARPR